jgi:hypothetical protein
MLIQNDVIVTFVMILLKKILRIRIKILRRNPNEGSAKPTILKIIDVSLFINYNNLPRFYKLKQFSQETQLRFYSMLTIYEEKREKRA